MDKDIFLGQDAAIDGEALRRLRESRGLSLEQVATSCGLSSRTVGDIERGSSKNPQLRGILRMLRLYAPTSDQVMSVLGLETGLTGSESDASLNDKDLLQLFDGMSYRCLYMSDRQGLEYFDIGGLINDGGNYLRANGAALNYQYRVTLTCAHEGTFAFIDAASARPLSDRVHIIVPFSRKVRRRFEAGIGAVLSLGFPKGEVQRPRFQLICIVSVEQLNRIGYESLSKECLESLRLPNPYDCYRIDVDDIAQRSDAFYHRIREL